MQHGSISAAARTVHLTQPAVTQAIANLERELGVRLFEREGGGTRPTDAAAVVCARAAAALALIDSSRVTAAQMRAFLAVARAGGYTGGAALTGLSTASLHRAVADLSIALGQQLVEPRGRGVSLTPRGRQAARRFALARAELDAMIDELASLQGREVGRIAVGAMPLARARLLPAVMARFHAEHPDFSVAVAEGSHAELLGPLRDGELDVLIGALRDPSLGADLCQQPLFEDRPVVVGRADHPLVGTEPTLPALARYPWTVAGHGAPLRMLWERMFAEGGVAVPRVPIECGSVITIRQLLMASDFLTLLSPEQVAVELAAGWLAMVCEAPPSIRRVIGLTTRVSWTPTPLQRAFLAGFEAALPAEVS